MTLPQTTPEGAVLVAIDVAKHRNEVLIEVPGRSAPAPADRAQHAGGA